MNAIAATLTQVTTVHDLTINGVTFKDMREESRWEGFVKLAGTHAGRSVSAIVMLDSGTLAAAYRSVLRGNTQDASFIAGSPGLLEAAGLLAEPARVDTQA